MADVEIRVRLDADLKSQMAGMLPGAFARAISRAEKQITDYWRSIAPVSTGWKDYARYGPSGTLRDNFIVTTTPLSIQMFWTAPYARVADEGAPPHIIHGNPNLHFLWQRAGAWMRIGSVQHPGYTGHRFSDQMRIVAPQFLRQAIIEELQGIIVP